MFLIFWRQPQPISFFPKWERQKGALHPNLFILLLRENKFLKGQGWGLFL